MKESHTVVKLLRFKSHTPKNQNAYRDNEAAVMTSFNQVISVSSHYILAIKIHIQSDLPLF